MKYVVVEFDGKPVVSIFSDDVTHRLVANAMNRSALLSTKTEVKSAGFCRITATGVEAYGKSESIGLGAVDGDSELLTMFLGKK